MDRPKLLDLFCGAGGAAVGLDRAGFDVVGVDNEPQPRHPYTFILGDTLEVGLSGYSAFWASPPCPRYAWATKRARRFSHPDLVAPIRQRLLVTGKPYVIENVPGAPLIFPVKLCGTMFGLKTFRHRLFECNRFLLAPKHQKHTGTRKELGYCIVAGHSDPAKGTFEEWKVAMGIDWMNMLELINAVPPVYAEYLGRQLILYCTERG